MFIFVPFSQNLFLNSFSSWTLVYGSKTLSQEEYQTWHQQHHIAETAIEGREELLQKSFKLVETNLNLLGATAIEDKLQVGVPETIARLSEANIKIWVLTGDKLETAINIAYSCNLLTDKFKDVYIINSQNLGDVTQDINYVKGDIEKYERDNHGLGPANDQKQGFGLVVTGQALEYCLESTNKNKFLKFIRTSKD